MASDTASAVDAEQFISRLNALLEKNPVFSAEIKKEGGEAISSDNNAAASSSGKAGTSGRRKSSASSARSRLSEEDEDKQLMKIASQQENSVLRISAQPKLISHGKLRDYQLEGLTWLVRLHDGQLNGILADEMGLGKTLQTISLLAYMRESRNVEQPSLVIAPKSTISNWLREFARWCPQFRTVKLLGSKDERRAVCRDELSDPTSFDVVIASFESCLLESRALNHIKWKYVVIDEAHRIKNESSELSKMVRKLTTDRKLLLTGTPLQNNLHELWALLNFLLPEVFDDSDRFDSWFNIVDSSAKDNVMKRLYMVLRPFMLRRVKTDVETDLPPKKEMKLYTGLSALQKEWYIRILSKDIESLNALGGGDRVKLLNVLMQLRKVCNHPYLFEGAEPGPPFINGPHLWEVSGKMVVLDKLLTKLRLQGSRVLIFTQMTRMLDILEDYLLLKSYEYCRIDGNSSSDDRESAMEEFNKPGSSKFVFILSTRAGGLGINLQTADTVILYDSDWNPQADLQAMDRAHRIGQKKEVRVFRFITEGTIEEKIVERAEKKLFLDAAVIQQGRLADKHGALSRGEIMTMVRFGADEIINHRGEGLTDEDIDAILARGEAKTEALTKQVESEMKHNLANFSFALDEVTDFNFFTFEGEDYRGKRKSANKMAAFPVIALPGRDRKRGAGDMSGDGSGGAGGGAGGGGAGGGGSMGGFNGKYSTEVQQRKKRTYQFPDFQFFNRSRIEAIVAMENDLSSRRDKAYQDIKDLKSQYRKDFARPWRPHAEVPDDWESPDLPEGARVLVEHVRKLLADLDQGSFDLSQDVTQEKAQLLREGFRDWNRRDFKVMVDAIERYGSSPSRKEQVVSEVCLMTAKDTDAVSRYYDTFFERMSELSDYKRIAERIERTEKRLQREKHIEDVLSWKMSVDESALDSVKIHYHSGSRGKTYTELEDVYLLWLLHHHGYGRWEEIRTSLLDCDVFACDWFIRSRSAAELQKRCDLLIRYVEKEFLSK